MSVLKPEVALGWNFWDPKSELNNPGSFGIGILSGISKYQSALSQAGFEIIDESALDSLRTLIHNKQLGDFQAIGFFLYFGKFYPFSDFFY